jgi:hypothetical protein
MLIDAVHRPVRQQRAEVILKNMRPRVDRVSFATGPFVAWAKVTTRIERSPRIADRRFLLSLPRTLRAMWRDQYPTAGQRIKSAVRVLAGIEGAHKMLLSSKEV